MVVGGLGARRELILCDVSWRGSSGGVRPTCVFAYQGRISAFRDVQQTRADVDYVFPIGFDVRFVGLFNDFVSEGRVFEVFL